MSSDVGQSIEDSKELIGQLMKQPDFSESLARDEGRSPRFKDIEARA